MQLFVNIFCIWILKLIILYLFERILAQILLVGGGVKNETIFTHCVHFLANPVILRRENNWSISFIWQSYNIFHVIFRIHNILILNFSNSFIPYQQRVDVLLTDPTLLLSGGNNTPRTGFKL